MLNIIKLIYYLIFIHSNIIEEEDIVGSKVLELKNSLMVKLLESKPVNK